MTTGLAPALHAAWAASTYRFQAGDQAYCLRIGQTQPAVDDWMRRQGWEAGAFLTHCNPLGVALDEATNAARQQALLQQVTQAGWAAFAGQGEPAPSSPWVAEPSLFILGLDAAAATALALQGRQLGYLWHRLGQRTQLCLTGLQPAGETQAG